VILIIKHAYGSETTGRKVNILVEETRVSGKLI
jgi:hypothetical protein